MKGMGVRVSPPGPNYLGVRMKTLGQIAFEAYVKQKGNLAHDGSRIPEWGTLKSDVVDAWEASAQAVKEEILKQTV